MTIWCCVAQFLKWVLASGTTTLTCSTMHFWRIHMLTKTISFTKSKRLNKCMTSLRINCPAFSKLSCPTNLSTQMALQTSNKMGLYLGIDCTISWKRYLRGAKSWPRIVSFTYTNSKLKWIMQPRDILQWCWSSLWPSKNNWSTF